MLAERGNPHPFSADLPGRRARNRSAKSASPRQRCNQCCVPKGSPASMSVTEAARGDRLVLTQIVDRYRNGWVREFLGVGDFGVIQCDSGGRCCSIRMTLTQPRRCWIGWTPSSNHTTGSCHAISGALCDVGARSAHYIISDRRETVESRLCPVEDRHLRRLAPLPILVRQVDMNRHEFGDCSGVPGQRFGDFSDLARVPT